MIARDLLDTLISHREICVGMAANMIGKAVRIIVFIDGAKTPRSSQKPPLRNRGRLSVASRRTEPACRGSQFAQLTLLSEFTVELAL